MKRVSAFVLLAICAASGCTTLDDLQVPTEQKHFVLQKDHVRIEHRGIAQKKHVEGLRAGSYSLIREDRDGFYFSGTGDCVLILNDQRGDKYLQTGEVTPFEIRNREQFTFAGGAGGLWLPKPGVQKEPRLFWNIRNTTDGAPLGLTGVAIVGATEGSLGYLPFGAEKDFLASIAVLPGAGPQIPCGSSSSATGS